VFESKVIAPEAGTTTENQTSLPENPAQPGAGAPDEEVEFDVVEAVYEHDVPTVKGVAEQGSSFEGAAGGVPIQTLNVLVCPAVEVQV
jgi:hypothetical protein